MDIQGQHFLVLPVVEKDDSMFKSLLTQIQLEITSVECKSQKEFVVDFCEEEYYYDDDKQLYGQAPNKSMSEWVWKDEFDQQLQQIPVKEENPFECAQLRRVQSMRMQQQNKLSQFIRLNNFINQEQGQEFESDIKQTMNLSPRKKKRIDKEKQKHHLHHTNSPMKKNRMVQSIDQY